MKGRLLDDDALGAASTSMPVGPSSPFCREEARGGIRGRSLTVEERELDFSWTAYNYRTDVQETPIALTYKGSVEDYSTAAQFNWSDFFTYLAYYSLYPMSLPFFLYFEGVRAAVNNNFLPKTWSGFCSFCLPYLLLHTMNIWILFTWVGHQLSTDHSTLLQALWITGNVPMVLVSLQIATKYAYMEEWYRKYQQSAVVRSTTGWKSPHLEFWAEPSYNCVVFHLWRAGKLQKLPCLALRASREGRSFSVSGPNDIPNEDRLLVMDFEDLKRQCHEAQRKAAVLRCPACERDGFCSEEPGELKKDENSESKPCFGQRMCKSCGWCPNHLLCVEHASDQRDSERISSRKDCLRFYADCEDQYEGLLSMAFPDDDPQLCARLKHRFHPDSYANGMIDGTLLITSIIAQSSKRTSYSMTIAWITSIVIGMSPFVIRFIDGSITLLWGKNQYLWDEDRAHERDIPWYSILPPLILWIITYIYWGKVIYSYLFVAVLDYRRRREIATMWTNLLDSKLVTRLRQQRSREPSASYGDVKMTMQGAKSSQNNTNSDDFEEFKHFCVQNPDHVRDKGYYLGPLVSVPHGHNLQTWITGRQVLQRYALGINRRLQVAALFGLIFTLALAAWLLLDIVVNDGTFFRSDKGFSLLLFCTGTVQVFCLCQMAFAGSDANRQVSRAQLLLRNLQFRQVQGRALCHTLNQEEGQPDLIGKGTTVGGAGEKAKNAKKSSIPSLCYTSKWQSYMWQQINTAQGLLSAEDAQHSVQLLGSRASDNLFRSVVTLGLSMVGLWARAFGTSD